MRLLCVPAVALHGNQNLTAGSELDGIAHQICDHLPDSTGVSHKASRDAAGVLQNQVKPFLFRPGREHLIHFFDYQAQVKGKRLNRQLSCFDLREIKNVVDHGKQCFARHPHGLRVVPLFGGQVCIEQYTGHADHTVHRCSDFMAHVREKLALGDSGALSRAPCRSQPERLPAEKR